jgi:hypothetical protein
MDILLNTRICLASLVISLVTQASGQTSLRADLFDETRLSESGRYFQFSIDDGPRRGIGQPVDFSELLKSDLLLYLFTQSLFNCLEGVRHCERERFRVSVERLPLKIFFERGELVESDFDVISNVLESTMGIAGFSIPPEHDPEDANIILVIGSVSYLTSKVMDADDPYGVLFFEQAARAEREDSASPQLEGRATETCYVATIDRELHQRVSIYLQGDELESCLPRSLMVVLGLNETNTGLPTVTDRTRGYTTLTFADQLFLKMLYSEDFPVNSGVEPIRDFWNLEFEKLSSEVLSNFGSDN